MNPSICLIVGDNHTQHCGVKDYAIQLRKALHDVGLSVDLMAPNDWGVMSFLRFCERLRQRQFDIIHLQYPSIGHRKSLFPHFVGRMRVAKGAVVTLHEYSYLPMSQRISTNLFRWTVDRLLFTTEAESLRYGPSGVTRRVIPIGSNVPGFSSALPRMPTVLYFGQIRPAKGLEGFLELARRSLQLSKRFKFQVIGSVPRRRADYYKVTRENAVPEIEWLIDLPFEQVAQRMAISIAAYLPFPDGASYRRGSLLAALANGLPIITTIGAATPPDMLDVVLPATDPGEALTHLERLFGSPGEVQALGCAARSFAKKFSWAEIARQHQEVYNQVLWPARNSGHRTPIRNLDSVKPEAK